MKVEDLYQGIHHRGVAEWPTVLFLINVAAAELPVTFPQFIILVCAFFGCK